MLDTGLCCDEPNHATDLNATQRRKSLYGLCVTSRWSDADASLQHPKEIISSCSNDPRSRRKSASALWVGRIWNRSVVGQPDLIWKFVVEFNTRFKRQCLPRNCLECLLNVDRISCTRLEVWKDFPSTHTTVVPGAVEPGKQRQGFGWTDGRLKIQRLLDVSVLLPKWNAK